MGVAVTAAKNKTDKTTATNFFIAISLL